MKQWKKGIVTTALAMGLVMPIGAQAQSIQAQPLSNPGAVTSVPEQESQDHHGHHKFKMRLSVHQKMYMTLLAEKYTPKQAAEWQSVFKERERLIGELKAARKTSSQEGKMNKQAKTESEDADHRAHMEKSRQVYKEFHAAIESGEEAKIKEVLPKLLEQMKAKNERLAKKVAEAKK